MDIKIGDICMYDFKNDVDGFVGIRPCIIVEIKDDNYTVIKLTTNKNMLKTRNIKVKKGIETGLKQDAGLVNYLSVINPKLIISKIGHFNLYDSHKLN